MKPIVGYIRVSTSQQCRSGPDIEAQREALAPASGEGGGCRGPAHIFSWHPIPLHVSGEETL